MKRYFYFAVTVQENGKYYSYVEKISSSQNILSKLNAPGVLHANICETKKRAVGIVERWNAIHRAQGLFLFDTPEF